MKGLFKIMAVALLGFSLCGQAASPDQQFAFADKLMSDGDEAFAMLEFKRFLFESPKHHKAPDAMYRIAQIQLSYVQNLAGAKNTLRQIRKDYPKTDTARKAQAFADYIEVNSDFGGKPLLMMLAARSDEKAGKHAEAAAQYKQIVTQFPRARLAPDAAHDLAVVQLRQLKKPGDARNTLHWLTSNHPKHALRPECDLLSVEIMEIERGPSREVVAAYREVAKKHPKHAVAKAASKKATALEKQAYAIKRQYGKEFIRTYAVKQQGYRSGQKDLYVVEVEIPKDCSEREIKATLEDVLVKEGAKRQTPTHRVSAKAYFSYPLTEAGAVTWTPGNAPAYVIPQRRDEDVLKDVFIDLLKRRR